MTNHSSKSERGFTLVSVMIAIILLNLGLLALVKAQGVLARSQTDTATRATALAIAQGYTEVLRSRNPATLASEAAVQVDAEGQPAADGVFFRSSTVTSDAANLLRVTVNVTYPRGTQPITLITLIYKPTAP